MLYKIYYPSSITNQSLSITGNDNDTVTTSNGTIYRNMQVQTYNFNATGSSGYTAGNIFIDNVDQGSSTVSNYVVQKDINITIGEATFRGFLVRIYYRYADGTAAAPTYEQYHSPGTYNITSPVIPGYTASSSTVTVTVRSSDPSPETVFYFSEPEIIDIDTPL